MPATDDTIPPVTLTTIPYDRRSVMQAWDGEEPPCGYGQMRSETMRQRAASSLQQLHFHNHRNASAVTFQRGAPNGRAQGSSW